MKDKFATTAEGVRHRAWDAREALDRPGTRFRVNGGRNVTDIRRSRLHKVQVVIDGNDDLVRFHPTCRLVNASFRLVGTGLRIELGEHVKMSLSVDLRRTGNVGRHIWLSERTTVFKGVTIVDNTTIATGSVASNDIGSGVVAGGVPARVLRTRVNWNRRQI